MMHAVMSGCIGCSAQQQAITHWQVTGVSLLPFSAINGHIIELRVALNL